MRIKEFYASGANKDNLRKGDKNTNKIHKDATSYAIHYNIYEGYNLEYAIIKGCLLWNQLHDCEYFSCKLPLKKSNMLCDYLDSDDVLATFCRLCHRKADPHLLRRLQDEGRTYWKCYMDALQSFGADEEVTKQNIKKKLKKWNKHNGMNLFVFKSSTLCSL
jgi:hypothetical protein